jgi:hypothetical protein
VSGLVVAVLVLVACLVLIGAAALLRYLFDGETEERPR